MILRKLVDYYDRLAADPTDPMTPNGFSREGISFALVIAPDGTSAELQDIRDQQGKKSVPQTMTVPDRGGRSGIGLKPNFLWDNSGYVMGRDSKAKPGKPDRAPLMFESFRDFHIQMASSIDDPELAIVAKYLATWSPAKADSFPLLAEAMDKNIAFKIRGSPRYVHDSPIIQQRWKAPIAADETVIDGQSLIGGETGPIARLHPLISGVRGAQTMGAALASFNLDAFTSYGLEQTYNAPVSAADAFKYTTALNRLLENRHRRTQLGDATVVFWADRPTLLEDTGEILFADMPAPKADAPPEDIARVQQVKVFLSQLRKGHADLPALKADSEVGFYILGLSPNASRLSVRFWICTTVGQIQEKLAQHLRDMELVGARPDDPPVVIRRIVLATGRAEFTGGTFKGYDTDAAPPLLAGSIARAVLQGTPYPPMLLGQMLNRIRADGHISHVRVATIKACINRNTRQSLNPMEVPVALDTNRPDPAYVTGRLFALLEKIQTDSLGGDLNTTIKDRYFSAASATPASVFPRLIRLSQHHLAKLETGQKIFYERLLGDVMNKLSAFAGHLNLQDQGLFAIGYFHQRQDLFTKKTQKEGASA